jgi:hypothetical protein
MVTERLEVRLDKDRRRKLAEMAAAKGVPVSEVVRRMVDREYDEVLKQQRMGAVEAIARLEIEDVPDPETLCRQLSGAYDLPDLP